MMKEISTLFETCVESFGSDYGPLFYKMFVLSTIKHKNEDNRLIRIFKDVELLADIVSKVDSCKPNDLDLIIMGIIGDDTYSKYC